MPSEELAGEASGSAENEIIGKAVFTKLLHQWQGKNLILQASPTAAVPLPIRSANRSTKVSPISTLSRESTATSASIEEKRIGLDASQAKEKSVSFSAPQSAPKSLRSNKERASILAHVQTAGQGDSDELSSEGSWGSANAVRNKTPKYPPQVIVPTRSKSDVREQIQRKATRVPESESGDPNGYLFQEPYNLPPPHFVTVKPFRRGDHHREEDSVFYDIPSPDTRSSLSETSSNMDNSEKEGPEMPEQYYNKPIISSEPSQQGRSYRVKPEHSHKPPAMSPGPNQVRQSYTGNPEHYYEMPIISPGPHQVRQSCGVYPEHYYKSPIISPGPHQWQQSEFKPEHSLKNHHISAGSYKSKQPYRVTPEHQYNIPNISPGSYQPWHSQSVTPVSSKQQPPRKFHQERWRSVQESDDGKPPDYMFPSKRVQVKKETKLAVVQSRLVQLEQFAAKALRKMKHDSKEAQELRGVLASQGGRNVRTDQSAMGRKGAPSPSKSASIGQTRAKTTFQPQTKSRPQPPPIDYERLLADLEGDMIAKQATYKELVELLMASDMAKKASSPEKDVLTKSQMQMLREQLEYEYLMLRLRQLKLKHFDSPKDNRRPSHHLHTNKETNDAKPISPQQTAQDKYLESLWVNILTKHLSTRPMRIATEERRLSEMDDSHPFDESTGKGEISLHRIYPFPPVEKEDWSLTDMSESHPFEESTANREVPLFQLYPFPVDKKEGEFFSEFVEGQPFDEANDHGEPPLHKIYPFLANQSNALDRHG